MLSDAEQRQLTALESHLRADDPAFVERFTGERQRRVLDGWRRLTVLIAIIGATMTIGFGLMIHSVLTVVIALIAVGGLSGWWITDRRRSAV
jgi:hypothetical protein